MAGSSVSWIAGGAALLSGAGVAFIQQVFGKNKNGAETSQIVQQTYSAIVSDLNKQLELQEARCDERMDLMEQRLMSRIHELESELEVLRSKNHKEK